MDASVPDERFVCRQCPPTGFARRSDASIIPTGYQCRPGQKHIICQCCVQPMPDRLAELNIHQSCEICHQHFCNIYFQQCQRQGCLGCLNHLRNFNFGARHLTNLVNDSPTETQIVQNYLTTHRVSMRELLLECCQRLDRKEFFCTDIDRNLVAPSTKVVCYKCGLRIFKELAYQFRIAMKPKDITPVAMRNRENCYYGKHCRTQYTKPAHAQKYNHACNQTKFNS
ncbi:hypothetical protein I4U23_019245 [Adineta vaga]|nr:hypothetical protein I4U23_019245 [Adineta vaga]